MKTVDNDELSNLVLKGELTQEEALSMTDDKEQLLRMIKNKRWTHHYLRALIYQKHAIQKASMLNKSLGELDKLIDQQVVTVNILNGLAERYSDELKEIQRKRNSYDRLSDLKARQRLALIDTGVPRNQWPADILKKDERLKRAEVHMLAQLQSLGVREEYYDKLTKALKERFEELGGKVGEKILEQTKMASEIRQYTIAQRLSGYAAIASSLDDLFQMMADAMLA